MFSAHPHASPNAGILKLVRKRMPVTNFGCAAGHAEGGGDSGCHRRGGEPLLSRPLRLSYVSTLTPMRPCAPNRQLSLLLDSSCNVMAAHVPDGSHLAVAASGGPPLAETMRAYADVSAVSVTCRAPVSQSSTAFECHCSWPRAAARHPVINCACPVVCRVQSEPPNAVMRVVSQRNIGVCAGGVLPYDGSTSTWPSSWCAH